MTTPSKKTPKSLIFLCALSAMTCLALGGLVLWTGQKVARVEQDIQVKNQNLHFEQERIRVLRAEWSHLNSPERLDHLMQKKRESEEHNQKAHSTPLWGATNVNDEEGGQDE